MIYTVKMLKNVYASYSNPLDKIKRDCDSGILFRLNRGLYEDDRHANPMLLACHILSPSYISFHYALSYYGLIPERVAAITSATLNERKNKTYSNVFGRYEYQDVPERVFSSGLEIISDGKYQCRIASKEKAICDSLYKWRRVKNVIELKILLYEDERMDENEFLDCDFVELIRIASLYNTINHRLLIKLIKKEYMK